MMKNTFYFTFKALFVLKIFKFLFWLFGHVENDLNRKIGLISKCMTSQPDKQTIAMHILSNIFRSKDNQTVTFGQLLKYTMRNIFLQKSCAKFGGETSLRLFFKKSKIIISLDQYF